MLDTNTNILIKEVAFDIISVITIWGLSNNSYSYLNIHIYKNIYSISTHFIGIGFSIYIIRKYV